MEDTIWTSTPVLATFPVGFCWANVADFAGPRWQRILRAGARAILLSGLWAPVVWIVSVQLSVLVRASANWARQ